MIPEPVSDNEAIGEAPDDATRQTVTGLLRRGQAAARKGQSARAERLLRAALLADADNAEARLWLAAIASDAEPVETLGEGLQDHPPTPARVLAPGRRWSASIRTLSIVLSVFILLVGFVAIGSRSWAQGQWPLGATAGVPDQGQGVPSATWPAEPTLVGEATVQATEGPSLLPAMAQPMPETASPVAATATVQLPGSVTESPVVTTTPTLTTQPPAATPTPPPPATPTAVARPSPTPGHSGAGGSEKWIEVTLSTQTLIAWEGRTAVRKMVVSTGRSGTPTVTGTYYIYQKLTSTLMTGPGYYLPNVPHTMYFYQGYALHGAYWHNKFGTPTSHGCVNLSLSDAAWLFAWAGPKLPAGARSVYASASNPGTRVVIHR